MKKYVLDTNLYVRAFRSTEDAAELELFCRDFAPAIHLSSIVLHELLVGARGQEKRSEIEDAIAAPLRRTRRILTPSHSVWATAGNALAKLVEYEGLELRRVPKSFVLDVLLAEACREFGTTLVTDNEADFQRIRRFVRFEFRTPWPT